MKLGNTVSPKSLMAVYDESSIKMRSFIHSVNKYVQGGFLPCAAQDRMRWSIWRCPCPQVALTPQGGRGESRCHSGAWPASFRGQCAGRKQKCNCFSSVWQPIFLHMGVTYGAPELHLTCRRERKHGTEKRLAWTANGPGSALSSAPLCLGGNGAHLCTSFSLLIKREDWMW